MGPATTLRSPLQFVVTRDRSVRRARPTHGRATARAAILTGIVVAILAHAGLAVAVETEWPQWRDPEFFHRLNRLVAVVREEKAVGHTRPLVVVIGGSRSQMGLSPEHLGLGNGPADPVVFNCAQSGCLPVGERLNLARLLASGLVPACVLLEVLPPVLADRGPMDDRIPAARLGLADLERLHPYHTHPARVRSDWFRSRVTSWYTLRLPLMANVGLADALPPGPNRPDFLWSRMQLHGWVPFPATAWSDDQRAAGLVLARRQYGFLLDDFRIDPVNDLALRDALAVCRNSHIRAALFVMPESPTFRGWYPPAARQKVGTYLDDLSREFGVPVFDASRWFDDEAVFKDGHHLLRSGAEAFSKRFGRECVGPWVLNKNGPQMTQTSTQIISR